LYLASSALFLSKIKEKVSPKILIQEKVMPNAEIYPSSFSNQIAWFLNLIIL